MLKIRSLRLPVALRLQLATAAALITLGLICLGVYFSEAARIEQARIATLRAVTESAATIAAGYQAEEKAGRLTRAQAQAAALTALRALRYNGTDYVWVNDMHPTVVMHPTQPALEGKDVTDFTDPVGKHMFVAFADMVRAHGGGMVGYMWPRPGATAPIPKLSYVQGFAPWGWVIGTGVYADDLAVARHRVAVQLTTVAVLAGVLVGVITWALARGVVGPVRAFTRTTERLAAGDLEQEVPGSDRGDEFGALARALAVLRTAAAERVRLEQVAAAERTAKDRRQAAMERHTQDFGTSISGVMASLASSADAMRRASDTMTTATAAVHSDAQETSVGAAKSSRDLTQVAAAVEQLSASVAEISRQVTASVEVSRRATQRAEASRGTMQGLSEAATRIGDIVQLINHIAGQTNLLALNATIEAARAGDAGKGFAVVAGEVKALAAQTAKATADIGSQVEMVRGATTNAVAVMTEIGTIVGELEHVSAAISAAVEQQDATTKEIAGSVQAVATETAATARAMLHVVEAADSAGTASRDVMTGSREIGTETETLHAEIDQFLVVVRDDTADRRRYERIEGHGAEVGLRAGERTMRAVLRDISIGGALLDCEWSLSAGTKLEIGLPGGGDPVAARVVRSGTGRLAVVFGAEPSALIRIEGVLDTLAGGAPAAAPKHARHAASAALHAAA